jgi:hypothetical protein
MKDLASSYWHIHRSENPLPWHTDWFSTADLGFPLIDDQFHRDVHPLIRRYMISLTRIEDLSLVPIFRFRGGRGNDHCEICDQGTGRGPLIICDQCECTYHAN